MAYQAIIKDMAKAITIVFAITLFALIMPLFGFFCSLFLPLPIVYYRIKLGRVPGLAVPALAIVLLMLLLGGVTADVLFFIELLWLGSILSELFARPQSIERTILFCCGSVLFPVAAVLFFYSQNAGISLQTLFSRYMAQNIQLIMQFYEQMKLPAENMVMISDWLKIVEYWLVRTLPGMTIVSTLFIAWMNTMMARAVLIRNQLPCPSFGRLNRWEAPEWLIWVLIAGGGLALLGEGALQLIGLNGLIIVLAVYFFHGLAIVAFFFELKKLPRFARVTFYTLLALQHILVLIVIALGVFDIWLDLRKKVMDKAQRS